MTAVRFISRKIRRAKKEKNRPQSYKKMQRKNLNYASSLLILGMTLLFGCHPSTLEELQWDAEEQIHCLAEELHLIESKEMLQRAGPKIKKRLNKIACWLVEMRQFPLVPKESTLVSEQLFAELARLYEIPGCRECMESLEKEAVQILD